MNISDQIQDYIQRELANGRNVSSEESLLEAGVLDSLAIVKLVAFIEDEFDVEIPDTDFDPDNFESVSSISQLIERVRN